MANGEEEDNDEVAPAELQAKTLRELLLLNVQTTHGLKRWIAKMDKRMDAHIEDTTEAHGMGVRTQSWVSADRILTLLIASLALLISMKDSFHKSNMMSVGHGVAAAAQAKKGTP